jgi:hypothetical protein
MNIIHLKDALAEMKKPEPFSLSYVTCDQHRRTGGEIMKLEKVLLSHNENMSEELGFAAPEKGTSGRTRRPRHREHATRNVILPNGKIRKFHIRLMLQFNGKKVFY